ncbi:hypothetical protein [Dictyoglomus thermophilum]|uniref:Uncharacterized protein n=1 Tax=Dictyoglomus thermophilum (strain ATCC 35947 / DSM 3960 / H-6-12) TaxID=309799 RepID=B5YCQ9_DICT6|nr:hypothetical protein [Dictyoglomus thermophilum]ACI18741.1 conserved hypothetical protein [Dictyoglomus thermophilum H-6-12]
MLKTFKDLTTEEEKRYREALIKREVKRKEALKRKLCKTWGLVKEISRILYEKYKVREVIVFLALLQMSYPLMNGLIII